MATAQAQAVAEVASIASSLPSSVLPAPNPKRSTLAVLRYAAIAFLVQTIVFKPMRLFVRVKERFWPPVIRPDQVKTYACRSNLQVRVFFPKTYDRSKPAGKLPVMFTLHGGGFIIGLPQDTELWNAHFAEMHGAMVVGLDYGKAPRVPFPDQTHDVAALLSAVLDDASDLARHVDPSRVALLGWSAGGNLTLSASMLPSVRERITAGIVPVYPAVDFSTPFETKATLRRYKPELGGFRARPKDYLGPFYDMLIWCYVPAGHDLRDPLLSPLFADRDALPPRIFLVAVELDILSHEAWRFACKLAGKPAPAMDEPVGRQEVWSRKPEEGGLVLDDERYHFEARVGEGREARDYRWLLVPDTFHGYDMEVDSLTRDPKGMADARVKRVETMRLIGDWLFSRSS